MRLSEFRLAVVEAFGEDYAPTLCKQLVLTNVGSLTANEALERGVAPRDVWHALCDQMDVSPAVRAGTDVKRLIPPRR